MTVKVLATTSMGKTSRVDISDDPAVELHRWAAGLLQIDPEADLDERRRQALTCIEKQFFCPPPAVREAIQALIFPPASFRWDDWPEFSRQWEPVLEEAVRDLSERFLEIPAAQRKQIWQTLNAQCSGFPILKRRMMRLGVRLDLDLAAFGQLEGRAGELAQVILRFVTLPPMERAHFRSAERERMSLDLEEWEQAAEQLRKDHPSLASAGAELLDDIALISAGRAGATARIAQEKKNRRIRGVRYIAVLAILSSIPPILGYLGELRQGPRPRQQDVFEQVKELEAVRRAQQEEAIRSKKKKGGF